MSDKTKDTEEKAEESSEEIDPNTSWGRFNNEQHDPESVSYFVKGLLSQADPRLKKQLTEDHKRLHGVVDIFNGLMTEIMSTPGGLQELEKEIEKFIERQHVANSMMTEDPHGQENT